MLAEYAKSFSTVEINGTFYKLPSKDTVREWRKNVPDDFIFSVKANRYITHMKKLKDPKVSVKRLFDVLECFEEKIGPVLFQLPPNWKPNKQRLEAFFECLPSEYRYTFEFRDRRWLNDEIFDLLRKYNADLCLYDYEAEESPRIRTTDFHYIRLHGPEAQAYKGHYKNSALKKYAKYAVDSGKSSHPVFCYFDNDDKASAPQDAKELIKLTET